MARETSAFLALIFFIIIETSMNLMKTGYRGMWTLPNFEPKAIKLAKTLWPFSLFQLFDHLIVSCLMHGIKLNNITQKPIFVQVKILKSRSIIILKNGESVILYSISTRKSN